MLKKLGDIYTRIIDIEKKMEEKERKKGRKEGRKKEGNCIKKKMHLVQRGKKTIRMYGFQLKTITTTKKKKKWKNSEKKLKLTVLKFVPFKNVCILERKKEKEKKNMRKNKERQKEKRKKWTKFRYKHFS